MKSEITLVQNDDAMRALGHALAARLSPGDMVILSGPLGAGKTTLVQGLARGLGIHEAVSSPTYVIANEYAGDPVLIHMDAYRLEDAGAEDLRDAGLDEQLLRTDAIKVVEWPERIGPWVSHPAFAVQIEILPDQCRRVTVMTAHKESA